MNFKGIIADLLFNKIKEINSDSEISIEEITNNIEVPKEKKNGDYSFPCFTLAKVMKKAPVMIGNELAEGLENENFEKIENVNGFLNFYVSKNVIVKDTFDRFIKDPNNYGSSDEGKGKTVCVEFSSPNIAKPFHIGHLITTILGHSLYNIYKYLGYNTIALNHLGDYGTQFAKMIEGYKRFGTEYDFSENAIDKLADIYKRINEICEEDPAVLEQCRDTFAKLEAGDPECVEIWTKFKDLSLEEFNKIYDLLGIKFDYMNGESFYADKHEEVIKLLEEHNALTDSQGARVVDLTPIGQEVPFMVTKSNGSSIYGTRDLAAILYRTREYDFDKCLYVVANEQKVYFKNLFYVAQFLGIDEKYLNGLEHVGYGMVSLPEGKMSTRKGNFLKVEDILNDSISKTSEILADRDIEDKEAVAKMIGIGAIVFANQKENRIKDQVFDINEALNFNGETGPYVQYAAVRCKSILEKANFAFDANENIDYEVLTNDSTIEVVKLVSNFSDIIVQAKEKSEPSIITRYLIKVAQEYSSFYNKNKVICEEANVQTARLYLTYMVEQVLTAGLNLLGLKVPDHM